MYAGLPSLSRTVASVAPIRLETNADVGQAVLPRLHEGPGLRPRRRILERGVVVDALGADGHEVFDQTNVAEGDTRLDAVPHAAPTLLVRKIGGFDDESIALPVAP